MTEQNKYDRIAEEAGEEYYNRLEALLPSFEISERGGRRYFQDPISMLANDGQFFLIGPVTQQSCAELKLSMEAFLAGLKTNEVKYSGDSITLHIDSPGGSVDAGMTIYNLIQKVNTDPNSPVKINTHCYGMAASMGSFLLMCGHERSIDQDARVMIHRLSGGGNNGDKHTQEANGVNTDYTHYELLEKYCIHTGQDPETMMKAMVYENWFRGTDEDDAWSLDALVEYGMVDKVVRYQPKVIERDVKPIPEPRTSLNSDAGAMPGAADHMKQMKKRLKKFKMTP